MEGLAALFVGRMAKTREPYDTSQGQSRYPQVAAQRKTR